MTSRVRRLRRRGLARLRTMVGPAPAPSVGNLRQRVAELEEEMQEARRLNRRLAELMDVVEELLVPISQRDDERVQQYLSSNTTVLRAGSARQTDPGKPATAPTRDQPSGTG
jgi:hypothetical protein